MKSSRATLLSLALVAAAFVTVGVLYGRLPERVPIHWNAEGVADGFASKPMGPFLLPICSLLLFGILYGIQRFLPREEQSERSLRVLAIAQVAVLAFLYAVTLVALLAAMGMAVPIDRVVIIGVGLLFMVLGNFMGKLTKNHLIGIRTSWTLANDEVWFLTHRVAGKTFVLGGLGLIFSGWFRGGIIPLLVIAALVVGIPMIYSYVSYRRLEGARTAGDPQKGG